MTYPKLTKTKLAILATLAITTTLPAASAMAADPSTHSFVVKSTTDGKIKIGVKAFKKGNFEKSIRITQSALNSSLSPKKAAIAHSNLCAAYAKLNQLDKAKQACSAALELRPSFEPAKINKTALTIRLAQK